MTKHNLSLFNTTVSSGGITFLSPVSISLAIMGVSNLHARYLWHNDGLPLNENEWDALDADISLCLDELMLSIVGLIVPVVLANPDSRYFLPCDGGIYQRTDYPLLYDALDSLYVLDMDTFVTPNLSNRFPLGSGLTFPIGDTGGVSAVQLTIDEMPSHAHSYNQYSFGIDIESVGVPDPTGVGQPALGYNTSFTGGNNAHENMPPYTAIPFYIIAG